MSDPEVLDAQVWLNYQGESIPGYEPCAEDGQTGQQTMRSFIMVLQYLLFTDYGYPGTVSGTFGPTTYDLMVQYGDIQEGHYSTYMNNLVRHALWCKGYSGGYAPDAFTAEMGASVASMREDAGLTSEPVVTPKVMKALLNTDPYILVNNGDPEIQSAQRYINGKYIGYDNFFIGPCDGHTSRGYQKNIVMGIQIEAGLTGNDVDGMFGAGTSAAMQAPKFDLVFDPDGITNDPAVVRLFTAACLMNPGSFTAGLPDLQFSVLYDSVLSSYVSAFQQFSALERTSGTPDFDTWAQLIVSCGNPDRTYNVKACDLITTITPSRGQAIYNAGFRLVGRYLHEAEGSDPWLNKEIQPGELSDLFGAGLRCFPIWQYSGRSIDSFTYSIGRQHGELASYHATRHGFDVGTTIYFAVDYDALDAEVSYNIIPYFRGVEVGLQVGGNKYHPAIYAGRNACSRVSANGFARYSFVSGMSWGFSGNLGYPLPDNWTYNQIKEEVFDPTEHGESGSLFGLDHDVLRPGYDTGVNHTSTGLDQSELLSLLGDLYSAIAANGFTPPAESRVNEEELIRAYLASGRYPDDPWPFTNTNNDYIDNWMTYARSHFGNPPPHNTLNLADGLTISIPRLFASATVDYGSASMTYRDKYGWAGDLSRLYSQWRLDHANYASGAAFVDQNFARQGVDSCFSLPDFIADAMGYLLYRTTNTSAGYRYDEALEGGFQLAVVDHCQQFFNQRWGGSSTTLRSSAGAWLNENANDTEAWRREFLMRWGSSTGWIDTPGSIDSGALDSFLDGFTQRIVDLTNGEF